MGLAITMLSSLPETLSPRPALRGPENSNSSFKDLQDMPSLKFLPQFLTMHYESLLLLLPPLLGRDQLKCKN